MFARPRAIIIRSFLSSTTFTGVILVFSLLLNGLPTVSGQTSASISSAKDQRVQPSENNSSYSIRINRAAGKIPGNVNIFLSINDADATLRLLEKTPVNEGIRAFYERSNGGLLWNQLARRIGLTPDQLYSILLTRQLVFTARYEPRITVPNGTEKQSDAIAGGSGTDVQSSDPHGELQADRSESSWVVLAQTSKDDFRRILTGSNAEVVRWVGRTPVYGSKREESLDMAYSTGMAALAPQGSGSLLDEIITNRFTTALADKSSFVRSMKDSTGSIVFFARHPQWKKKFSTSADELWLGVDVSISDTGIRIRSLHHQPSEQQQRSISGAETRLNIDLAPFGLMDSGALAVIVERFTDEPAASVGSTSITAPFVRQKPSVLQFAGPTMFTVISAKDVESPGAIDHAEVVSQLQRIMRTGRQELTFAWGIELRGSAEVSGVMINELFLESLNALKVCVDHPQRLNIPKAETANPDKIQSVDLTQCAKQVLSVLPGNDNLNLYWATVRGDDRSWWLCATDLDSFNETRRALKTLISKRAISTRSAAGMISGPAVASLLDSWEEVNDKTKHPIFSRLFYTEELIKGIPRIQWVVDEDDNNITTTEIRADW